MASEALDISAILQRLATHSMRPRYTFMVLNLISEAAGTSGAVGPMIESRGHAMPVRDWLSDALAPMAEREGRRGQLAGRAMAKIADELPADQEAAASMIALAIKQRVRRSGKTNVSRAVSDLVRAGLLRRHYAGWWKDHQNRGGQRQAVYVVDPDALAALRRQSFLI